MAAAWQTGSSLVSRCDFAILLWFGTRPSNGMLSSHQLGRCLFSRLVSGNSLIVKLFKCHEIDGIRNSMDLFSGFMDSSQALHA